MRLPRFLNPFRISGMVTLGLILIGAAISLYIFFARPRHEFYQLRLSTGRVLKQEKSITKFFRKRALDYGLKFELVNTEGSEDSLEQIQAGKLDLAVVKGGMFLGDRGNVRQVTALDIEAFHLLVKGDDRAAKVRADLGALKGMRININKPATGTHHWSLDLLAFAGLHPKPPSPLRGRGVGGHEEPGNFTPATLGNPELQESLRRIEAAPDTERGRLVAEMPEAILFADKVPSPIARGLVNLAHYRLVPLDFGPAYVQERHAGPPLDKALDQMNVMIEVVTIPPYTYSVSPAVPPQGCATIGVRRLLIAHQDVPDEAVMRCLRLLYDGQLGSGLDFLEWEKVRLEYPPHDGVYYYDEERRQVVRNTIMKLIERLASVLGGITGCVLAIYGYIRYRRLLRFEHYFHEIRRIELIARGKEPDPAAPTERAQLLAYLRNKLADLRTAAIAEFAQGRLQGDTLILSIFTLLQDTSTNLATLLADKPNA